MPPKTETTTLREFICSCREDDCPRWLVVKRLLDLMDGYEVALREIANGPYNGFEQCKAIAKQALGEKENT